MRASDFTILLDGLQGIARPIILAYCRVILGVVFVAAGVGKILGSTEFAKEIAGYKFISSSWIDPIAMALPYVEVAAGAMLIVGLFIRSVATFMIVLLGVFAAAILYKLESNLDGGCNCFGIFEFNLTVEQALIRNGILLIMAVLIALEKQHKLSMDILLRNSARKNNV